MRSLVLWCFALAAAGCSAAPAPATSTTGTTVVPTTATSTAAVAATTTAPTTTAPETTAPPTTTGALEIALEVVGGEVTGGGRHTVPLGSVVVLRVTSDLSDEVHIHSYDLSFEVEAGVETRYGFTADVPGIFEVELERAGVPLVELEVRP